MADLDADAVVLLNKLTWESLPRDFRRIPLAWLPAWIGYDPDRKADYGVTKAANSEAWALKRSLRG